jgi:hypothetical protein
MKRKRQTCRRTAIHEAGHAVIGRVLGLTCGGATIVRDYADRSAGHAITGDPHRAIADWEARGRWRYKSMFRAKIMALMAGSEAENECLGGYGGGDGFDQHEIWGHLDEVRGPGLSGEPEQIEAKLRAKTRGLCRRHRASIVAVAKALLERGTLNAREIDAIVRRQMPLVKRIVPAGPSLKQRRRVHRQVKLRPVERIPEASPGSERRSGR